ncbi:MAG: biotin/lipoyl-binding carrier protein [Acidimicrobiaceae bacterium]|uniref:biotin/lipoyl-binding carrier protein n=1 Tax=Candidatus Poriferisodalis multihospitum TaxID=2983191 RepID=UPI0022927504|nr:biotin/lipoyl-binding carrier protein [Candidatus Poriferisodalis multihospitum]MCY3584971.1 biotin/lipoyl-binding carrier protein [Acidimicrobiaceae bacterium]MCY3892959.1 biotin/lipoyl-binding carrier protein [Acidimicrobiaceae bacterium]MCY3949297.1 biotin/lipoyl-binding carrier protein [Acidimicrobiaceae bacterium]MDE0133498.1 biotin/lipoyl-binding carrier protein [Acidimicrobiaceae bacterium]MDE0320318.1 biotin/lipoyl-binding carrier protein [Acidimicrobiaceae bacterium]
MLDVRAELTATVWKVVAEVGTAVAAGDDLLILESMKMEIPVTAPESGTLAEMHVAEGDSVAEGDVLAVVATS